MKEFQRKIDNVNVVNYRLGENAKENHIVVDEADPNDWWFHIDGFPSGHCIVEKIDIDLEDITFASKIIKENSKFKNHKNIRICYTQVKNLKKTKNPGEVKLLKDPEVFIY
tara:strand:- start:1065 stop:1397 length:333 start_codon:yes stop_codon:yes gene_type:complete